MVLDGVGHHGIDLHFAVVHEFARLFQGAAPEREFFIDNLLVRIIFIIEMIWRASLAPCDFARLFQGADPPSSGDTFNGSLLGHGA